MKRALALLTTTAALISWEALAYNNPHILEVDLDIEGVVDTDEFSPGPGGFVASNGWKRIFLHYTGTNLPTKTRLNWDSEKIEVDGRPGPDQIYWDPASTMPTQLWVKGLSASDTGPSGTNCGPEHLTLEAINNGTPYVANLYDRVAFTVYEVTNIVAIPKGITTNDTLPYPVTIGAGALDSEAHQADVTIQVRPAVANIPVEVSLLDGRGHDAGKDAKLAMEAATATGGCAAVTVQTGAGGEIPGVLTSSDVLNSGTIHAGEIDKIVAFTWDQYTEDEQWTNVQEYLPFPGVLTNYVVLRHHRILNACTPTNPVPYKPFVGHEIHFFVKQVEYWDAEGNMHVTNNTPPVSGGLSEFAAFVQEAYTTDGGGQVVPLLQVYTNHDISSVTMVGYDYSVWNTAAVSGTGAGGSGTAGSLQAGGEPPPPPVESPTDHPGTPGTSDVVRIESDCASPIPSDLSRTNLGIGEDVFLTAIPNMTGLSWSVSSGTLSDTNGNYPTFIAPNVAGSVVITLYYPGGTRVKTFSVFAPTTVISATIKTTVTFAVGTAAVGMELDPVVVGPTNVSFGRVRIMERAGPATNVTGYFTTHSPPPHDYGAGADHVLKLEIDNTWEQGDRAVSRNWAAPWSPGSYTWDIPVVCWVANSGVTNSMTGWSQVHTIDSNGTMTVEKFGRGAQRTTSNVYSTW